MTVFALNLPDNGQPPNAPVSYPFIWDTPQHDRVQWNGSASNSPSGVGPLVRNAGEVVGVFGHVEISRKWWWPWGGRKYSGSVDIKNLGKLEKQLESLWSPLWPEDVLGDIDEDLAALGKEVYNDKRKAQCVQCHAPIARTSKDRRIEAKMVRVKTLGTDSTMAYNFVSRRAKTGLLKGKKKFVIAGDRFGEEAPTIDLVEKSV